MTAITMEEVKNNGLAWVESHNQAKELRNKAVFAALEEAIARKTFIDKIAEFKRVYYFLCFEKHKNSVRCFQ